MKMTFIMDSYRIQLKELEKAIEKRIESIEISHENLEGASGLDLVNKDLEEFKESLEKIKNSGISKHDEVYFKQFSGNYSKLRQRFLAARNSVEGKKWQKELIGSGSATDTTQIDILLSESRNLDNSLDRGREIINTAHEVKASLAYQKEKIMSTSDKIVKFVETVPGISTLIGKISRRKRFNAIVIGITIFICLVLTIIYLS